MKWTVTLVVATSLLGASANAQNLRAREPDTKNGQPITGQPQTTDPRTTTGQAPVAVPGAANPYGAKGGTTGTVNPDRVPGGSPGGNPIPSRQWSARSVPVGAAPDAFSRAIERGRTHRPGRLVAQPWRLLHE
jgi:hypothetical protein